MSNGILGRWCKARGELAFADEVKLAVEVASTHEIFDGQLIVEIHDDLEGGEVPLWAMDSDWLYLLRPEGVWKTRLPGGRAWSSVQLHVKSPGSSIYMHTLLGVEVSSSERWRHGMNEYRQPIEADLMRKPHPSFGIDATEIGLPLVGPPLAEGGKFIFKVGAEFHERPDLFYDGKWIYGSVRSDPSRKVAFDTFDDPVVLEALRQDVLMLRFCGDLLLPFDVEVRARRS